MLSRAEAQARLADHGQEHVLRWFDALAPQAQHSLLQQVASIDFALVERVLRSASQQASSASIEPFEQVIRLGDDSEAEAIERGRQALRAGQVGVLLVAGGAGTRLGFDGPKGAFALGAVSGRTLFQMHVERLLALGGRYGVVPPLYLMTGPDNHEQTCELFARADNFGMPAERLLIFQQGVVPAVDEQGKVLMAARETIVLTANGNGGLFAALRDGGAFAHMAEHGVETISYIQVDNPLARSCDPLFVGHHLRCEAEFSCKAMPKTGPLERVGNFARVDGRLGIVEYTEIPEALATAVDARGELRFGYGNPGIFCWSREFLERQAGREDLPYHKAHKKIAHVDERGELVEPAAPNAFKLESFALDTLMDTERTLVLACERDHEFAPVKNASGVDSPESARALMTALYRGWIEAAGGRVTGDRPIEISPLYALDAAELREKVPGGFETGGNLYLR